jgi:hypothetical protein
VNPVDVEMGQQPIARGVEAGVGADQGQNAPTASSTEATLTPTVSDRGWA